MAIVIGKVGKPHGLRGEVYVRTDAPAVLTPGAVVRLEGVETTVAGSRRHADRLLVAFEGVEDRAAAEALRGHVITAETVALAPDEYLIEDLVGREIRIGPTAELGRIVDVVTSSPQHRLVVLVGDVERDVPFHPAIVDDVGGELVINPPEGLLS